MSGEAAVGAIRPVPRAWLADVALLGGFAAITVALLVAPPLLRLDVAVRDASDAHRPPVAYWAAWVLNHLGQGTPLAVLALAVAVVLAVRAGTARPVLPVLAAELLTYGVVGPLKLGTARAAPHYGPVELFAAPGQQSYPSGHLVNTIVWYAVLAALLTDRLPAPVLTAVRVVPVAVTAVTTVYLGYHWLTDTLAGLLLGLLLCRLLARVPWQRIPLPAVLDRGRS